MAITKILYEVWNDTMGVSCSPMYENIRPCKAAITMHRNREASYNKQRFNQEITKFLIKVYTVEFSHFEEYKRR